MLRQNKPMYKSFLPSVTLLTVALTNKTFHNHLTFHITLDFSFLLITLHFTFLRFQLSPHSPGFPGVHEEASGSAPFVFPSIVIFWLRRSPRGRRRRPSSRRRGGSRRRRRPRRRRCPSWPCRAAPTRRGGRCRGCCGGRWFRGSSGGCGRGRGGRLRRRRRRPGRCFFGFRCCRFLFPLFPQSAPQFGQTPFLARRLRGTERKAAKEKRRQQTKHQW